MLNARWCVWGGGWIRVGRSRWGSHTVGLARVVSVACGVPLWWPTTAISPAVFSHRVSVLSVCVKCGGLVGGAFWRRCAPSLGADRAPRPTQRQTEKRRDQGSMRKSPRGSTRHCAQHTDCFVTFVPYAAQHRFCRIRQKCPWMGLRASACASAHDWDISRSGLNHA